MPAIDPNKGNTSRENSRTVNKHRAERVKKARRYLTKPAPKGSAPVRRAPDNQIERGGAGGIAAAEKNYAIDEARRLVKDKKRPLVKKEKTIQELARLGILPEGYLSGLQGRARDEARAAQKAAEDARPKLGPPRPLTSEDGPLSQARQDWNDAHAPAAEREKDKAELKKYLKTHKSKPLKLNAVQAGVGGAINGGLLRTAGALIEGTVRDPVGVPSKTAKQAVAAIPAALTGVADLVQHPIKTVKEGAKEFGDRQDETYDEKLKRIRKEGGFIDAADLAMVTAGAGGAVAKAAMLGKAAERAAVRTSGGVVTPRRKGGVAKAYVGGALDQRRGRRLARELEEAEAGGKPMEPVRHAAAVANRDAGRTAEVVPRNAGKAQRRDIAKRKGRGVYALKADQSARTTAAAKQLNRLSKAEKRAFYYAAALGIRTAGQARELLPTLAAKIAAERTREGIRVTGSLKKSDMLPDIEKILANPEPHFTAKLAEVVEGLRPDSIRAGREDPSLAEATTERRRYSDLADILDVRLGEVPSKPAMRWNGESWEAKADVPALRYIDETDAEHLARVKSVAHDERGLAEPLYFRSERYSGPTDYAARALGGMRAMKNDRTHEGRNLAVGLQDTRPAQYLTGLSRNIKRKHNWAMVADTLDAHAIRDLAPDSGTTISHLRARLHAKGIDEAGLVFWNPGVFRREAERTEPDAVDERFTNPEEADHERIADALNQSVVRAGSTPPEHLRTTSGWVAVPMAALRELERQSTPSGKVGRSIDIAKGKTSRAMLLTSPPWLAFQVVGNGLMATVASRGASLNPATWMHARRWWIDLPEEDKQRVGGILGLDSSNADLRQVKLGASTNSDLVNAYRAMKAHPVWHTGIAAGRGPSISQLNPLELMASADRAQNNAFRKVVGYSLTNREAVKRMGQEMSRVDRAQAKLVSILAKPPAEQLAAVARDRHVLEEHAEAVADWLGDYTTMSAVERTVINRAVMFYPFLRYSLRLTFYTMPAKHPAMTGLLGEIGALHADEIEAIFGSDQVFWNTGKVYFGEGGDITSIDLRRANPSLNALFDVAGSQNLGQAIGVLPPMVGWIADQLTHRSNFADREWRVNGTAAAYGAKGKDYGARLRARILLADAMDIYFPVREAKALTQDGVQGDDSLLGSERPVKFKGRTRVSLQKKFSHRAETFKDENRSVVRDLIPLIPSPSRDKEAAREQAIIRRVEAAGPKKRTSKGYFGAGNLGDDGKLSPNSGKTKKLYGALK